MTRAGGIVGGVITALPTRSMRPTWLQRLEHGTRRTGRSRYLGSQLLANQLVQAGLDPAPALGVVNRLMTT